MKISRLEPAKLRGECTLGFRGLEWARSQGRIEYSQYKGRHYGVSNDGIGGRGGMQPVNLHQSLVRTMVPFLAPNAPLSDVTPLHIGLTFEAELRQDIYDRQAEELRLQDVYQDAVIDCLLRGMAFTLNGVKSGGDEFTSKSTSLDMGKEFCRLIDLDDISIDPNAKSIFERRFIAHRYTVDKQDALDAVDAGCYGAEPQDYEDGILPNDHIATREEAKEIIEGLTPLESATNRADRIDTNQGDFYAGTERLGETVMLWDVVLYLNGQVWIVTLPANPGMTDPFATGSPDKFLACYRWNGPASGPINTLSFLRVPFNKMPLSLAQMQRDLAEIVDTLSNKTFRQMLRTKTLTIYAGSAENMAMAMRRSSEGGYIRGDPASVKTVQDGGLIADMMPGTQYFRDEWQNATGNMALASGSGDVGKTATAFEGLMQRIQGFLDFLRGKVEQLATDDLKVRAWFLGQNPVFKQRVQKTIGQGMATVGLSMDVMNPQGGMGGPGMPAQPGTYTLQGDTTDFEMRTRAFSMSYNSPVVQAQLIMQALSETIPMALQAGLDPKPTLSLLAKKLNTPELEQLVPDPISAMMAQQEAAMAAVMAGDPNGDGPDSDYGSQEGPAGRRLPANQRAQAGRSKPMPNGPAGMAVRMGARAA